MITAIIIDSREPEWVQNLKFGGIPTSITMLDHGDLLAVCDDDQMILVERKTPDDFLNSLRDGRVLPQVSQMQDFTRWNYLVITGDFQRDPGGHTITDRGQTGWSWAAVQGALLTIQEQGCFVTYAANDQDYEACILRLGNRDHRPDLLLAAPRMSRILSAQEAIIASLPGIGVERLQLVMDYCGTAGMAISALSDPNITIPGIPKNVQTKIRAALKLRDAESIELSLNDQNDEILKTIGG